MAEGSAVKYARYALGEILLVVIGILIALQINNWNEDRLERNLERDYLASMLNDLREDQAKISDAVEGNSILLLGLDDLLSLVADPRDDIDYQRELYIHSVVYTYWYLTVEFSELAMSQLKYGGGLRLIKDQQVTDAMLSYEQGIDRINEQYDQLKHYFHVYEASQKSIINLALGKKAYEHIEEDYLNILQPLETFEPLIPAGRYFLSDDPHLFAAYYGDLLFYRTALVNAVAFLTEQEIMAASLADLIHERYGLDSSHPAD